jgi:ribosome recycling factor
LFKRASAEGEHSKVAIRNIRRDAIEEIKKLQKDGLSKDVAADAENSMQETTNRYIALVDKHLAAKEKEMMAV